MKKKMLGTLTSALIITAILLTACSTTSDTTTTTTTTSTAATTTAVTTTATTTVTTTATTAPTTAAGMPKYGGTMTVALAADLASFESWSTNPHPFTRMIYDNYTLGKITTTPEEWGAYGIYWPKEYIGPCLFESWEEVGIDTVIFHVQEGVHFQNIPPVNGREMTADDIVYSWNRAMDPTGQVATSQNIKAYTKSIKALDDYTVEYKFYPDLVNAAGGWWANFYKATHLTVAHEVVEKYNGSLANPIGQVGTGPFIIKDYVPGSSFTCKRNPDYWGTDPRYPGNKLPYIDTVVTTVIPDLSTRLAALRTGKIARMSSVAVSQYRSLIDTTPELLYRRIKGESYYQLSFRNDLAPFKGNVKVRQALSMAIDRQSIVDQYYEGAAQYSPCYVPEHWPEHIPLDQFPTEIQEIFEYHPDKAKQLLVEAGYPDGFKTEIMIGSTSTEGIDIAQLVKTWWKENLNVDLTINVLEAASATSIRYKHTYPQIYYGAGGISYPAFTLSYFYQPDDTFKTYNSCVVKDPVYNEKYYAFTMGWKLSKAEQDVLWKDLVSYAREQVFGVDLPVPDTYIFWWPWLKGHWGQSSLTFSSSGDFYKYMWIDK